jgi:hypothetical protein
MWRGMIVRPIPRHLIDKHLKLTMNPRCLSNMASYDVASNICQALPCSLPTASDAISKRVTGAEHLASSMSCWTSGFGGQGLVPVPAVAILEHLSRQGLHSFTSELNLSALYWTGGARRGRVARVKGMPGGVWGMQGVFVCQTGLKLSRKVNECKPVHLQGPRWVLTGVGSVRDERIAVSNHSWHTTGSTCTTVASGHVVRRGSRRHRPCLRAVLPPVLIDRRRHRAAPVGLRRPDDNSRDTCVSPTTVVYRYGSGRGSASSGLCSVARAPPRGGCGAARWCDGCQRSHGGPERVPTLLARRLRGRSVKIF